MSQRVAKGSSKLDENQPADVHRLLLAQVERNQPVACVEDFIKSKKFFIIVASEAD